MIPYQVIIEGETNDIRFEKFCRYMLDATQGVTLVGTSKTWDLGRDGTSIGPSKGTHQEVLCCTIEKELDAKVSHDAGRLAQKKTAPEHVYYCCSIPLSEQRRDALRNLFRSYLPTSVTFMGSNHLAELADKKKELFRDFYPAEVRSAEAALQAFQSGRQTSETRGLRLALLAFASQDGQELRKQITRRAVLDVLKGCGQCDAAYIASKLSTDLGLPKPLSVPYVQAIIEQTTMLSLTEVADDNSKWRLTKQGLVEAESVPPEAALEVLSGRSTVKEALERLIGNRISEGQFDQIWATMLDFLSEYFYSNGLAIVSAVNSFLDNSDVAPGSITSLEKIIEEGAKKARAHIQTRELGDQIEQAIKDIFTERDGAAFDWLSRLCERFVALCALGIEATSSEEVRLSLVRNRIVLDTDVILTVLCEGEPDHKAGRELLSHFRQVGGRVLLSTPVLEEVAYHAWIAEREFKDNIALFGKVGPEELKKYLQNAFVRDFFLFGWQGKAKVEQWGLYIGGYRGSSAHDYSKLLREIQTKLLAERVPDLMDDNLCRDVTQYMKELASRRKNGSVNALGLDDVGKAETDGKVMGSLAALRDNLRMQGSDNSVILLTSSRRLRRAGEQFHSRLGAPNAVVSPGALSYLLSLIPGINLGMSTLRHALFEYRDSARLADTQRLALKVIKSTKLFDVPWATRGTLEEHLENALRREADRTGERYEVVRDKFADGDESVQPAQLIFEALRDLVVSDEKEKELREAHRRIAELEDQIRDVRASRTPTRR